MQKRVDRAHGPNAEMNYNLSRHSTYIMGGHTHRRID